MEKLIKQEEMDSRKWLEFGKMYNNMIQEISDDCAINLIAYRLKEFHGDDDLRYCIEIMNGADCVYSSGEDGFINPYYAMKDAYFSHYLGQADYEDVSFDLTEDQMKLIYKESDKQGITFDEFILNLLKEHIEKVTPDLIEEADCCYNCEYFSLDNVAYIPYCNKMTCGTEREYTCKNFYPRISK